MLIYELMDEIIDFGFPQFTDSQRLKNLVNTDAEKLYSGTFDYLVSQIPLEKLKLVDSVSEKDSERSIKKPTNDIFIEINEKISACFNTNGFAIHIKVNGLILVKNYIIKRINCNISFNENFAIQDDSLMQRADASTAAYGQFHQQNYNNKNKIKITQIHDSVDYDQLLGSRRLCFQPPLGQCIAMQYELEGTFNMLPVKLYPTFTARPEYRKLDLTLKVFNKLPQNLRCKGLTVTFRVPENVQRVFFKEQNISHELHWNQVKDVSSLSQYITGSYWAGTTAQTGKPSPALDPLALENGIAEYNAGKRKIIWKLKNVKGQMTKTLDVSLTYGAGVVIDELQFKQLGPFNVDFDIPNHTASTVKITKMDIKVSNDYLFTPSWNSLGGQDPNSEEQKGEPGKWPRHKTFSGSYVCRV